MSYEQKQKEIENEMKDFNNRLESFNGSKNIEQASKEFAEQGEWKCPTSFEYGAKFMQNKYEASNNWVLVEKQLPEK